MNFSEIKVHLPFFETEIWITPQRSHKCPFHSCKSPLPLFAMATEERRAPSPNPEPMTHMEWRPRWRTRAGRRHVCRRRCFPTLFIFFFFFSCHPLQHPPAVELIWGANAAWCHLWHVWKTSSRAAQKNGRQTLVRIRLATVLRSGSSCLLEPLPELGSPSADWTSTQMQIMSFRLGNASRGSAVNGSLTSTLAWQGQAAPPAARWPSVFMFSSCSAALTGPCVWAEKSWHLSV